MGSDASLDRTQAAMASLFRAPRPRTAAAAVVALSLVAGVLLAAVVAMGPSSSGFAEPTRDVAEGLAGLTGGASGPVALLHLGAVLGLVVFAVPALAAGAFGWAWHRATGGTAYLRRSMLVSLVSLGFVLPAVLVAWVAAVVWGPALHAVPVLLFAAALPLWIRYQAACVTANPRAARALPDAVAHYVLTLAVLPLGLAVPAGQEAAVAALAVGFGAVFLGAGAAVVESMRSFARADFGADLIELNAAILAHITEGGGAGRGPLEEMFRGQGDAGEADLGALAFVRPDGSAKAAVVVPGVHPGPFGTLGGSDLPRRLAEATDVPLVVLHGACTHEQNPVDRDQARRVAEAASELVGRAVDGATDTTAGPEAVADAGEPARRARPPVRVPGAVLAQHVGPAMLVVHAPAPQPRDDVDAATGRLVEDAVRAGLASPEATGADEGPGEGLDTGPGTPTVLFADAHHGFDLGSRSVRFPSPGARELADAARAAAVKAAGGSAAPLRVGMAGRTGFDLEEGVGPAGVQCLALAAGDHVTAYLVLDGNNMVPGLRAALRDALLEHVDEAEVLTTDNHVVNTVLDGYNPVGHAVGADRWVPVARELVEEAVADLEPVSCGAARDRVALDVFGAGTADRISVLVHLSTAAARRLMRVTLAGAAAVGAAVTVLGSMLLG